MIVIFYLLIQIIFKFFKFTNFLKLLQKLTSIKEKLVPDPYLLGGLMNYEMMGI